MKKHCLEKESEGMKKLWILPLLLLCLFPVFQSRAATKAEISAVRIATRNDAATPFVRTVLDVNKKVTPEVLIDKNGKYVTVSLPDTTVAANLQTKYEADPNVVSEVSLIKRLTDTEVVFKVPRTVTANDVNVFTLGSNGTVAGRVVVDINDKSGQVRQWHKWKHLNVGDKGIGKTEPVSKPQTSDPVYRRPLTRGLKGKVICIDPGHGGTDSGAVGAFSQEKNITFAIAGKVQSLLSAQGATAVMTRTSDVDVYGPHAGAVEELQARCNVGNIAAADVFVSIHIDSSNSAQAGGVTAYYAGGSAEGQRLAASLHAENMKVTNFDDRGVRTANFYVLNHTTMPAALLELGFISNPAEEKILNTDSQQQKFAESIVAGLRKYFR
jgi:N-acetylmuramoyl-L-alanine amidase